MTRNPVPDGARCGERGSALVGVLLLLLMMSALAAALGVSGHTETLVARNHQSAAQAEAAAEAGLNRAVQVTIAYLREWEANGFADVAAALNGLLLGPDGASGTTATDADNGSLADLGIPLGTRVAVPGSTTAQYEARVMDEDDPARGVVPSVALISENGNALLDANNRLLIRAIGYAQDNTTVVLEATLSPIELPAIVVDGDLTISGNPTIQGTEGSVHANGDLTISGSPSVQENATASGTYTSTGNPTVGGTSGGGGAELALPVVRAIDHRSKADYILTSGGLLTTPNGTVLCNASVVNDACKNVYAWEYQGANGWRINGNSNSAGEGTWYVEGKATISGNPGSGADPLAITIIAEGSIQISGNPDLTPSYPELTFVTDGDLKISGVLEVPLTAEGKMLVHEQLHISGNPALSGQILVENAPSVDNLVTGNSISGNPTITYNGTLGMDMFTVTGWREVR
jgi:cytoskeletal protein CcmA (bactofilin family)